MKKHFFTLLIIIPLFAFGQKHKAEIQKLEAFNDSLKHITKMLYSSETDAEREELNKKLLSTFEACLKLPSSFNFPFDSLNDVGRLMSPDKTFRIINWNIPYNDGSHKYYGFIQKKHKQKVKNQGSKKEEKEVMLLFTLNDQKDIITRQESHTGDNNNWIGMLYYKIIPKKTKNKTYYTLLAWDGNNKFSNKKIIDVVSFNRNGIPQFGAYLFNMNKVHQRRVIFEYSKSCSMSLKYDERKDSIIFDHLVPIQEQFEGQYQYYCPDLGLDGFGFKRGKWNFNTDVLARNEKTEQDKYYVDPQEESDVSQSDNFIEEMKSNKPKAPSK